MVCEEKPFSFQWWFPTITMVLSGIGVLSNIACIRKVWRGYDLRKAIYLTIFIDSCRTMLFHMIYFGTSLYFLVLDQKAHTFSGCTVLHTSAFTPFCLSAVSVSIVSCIRHDIMVHGHSEIRNRFQRQTAMILMSLPVLYIVLLKTYADYNLIFPFAEICLHGDEARPVSKEQGYVVIFLLFPELSAAILAITMDTRTYLKVRNHVQSNGESVESGARRVNPKEDMLEIPLRSTVFSLCLILPLFAIMIILVNMQFFSKVILALIGFSVISLEPALRNPIILGMTVKQNSANQNEIIVSNNKVELRELKRQVEIQHALEQRRLKQSSQGPCESCDSQPPPIILKIPGEVMTTSQSQ